MPNVKIANDMLRVEIAPLGAELQSIRDAAGEEWLWNGDPAWWAKRSPLLFPVVGRSPENQVSIGGKHYPMESHGFAARHEFTVDGKEQDRACLVALDTPATRSSFPFAFELRLDYTLDGATLRSRATVINRDTAEMPFQFGFHPAFLWPLPGSAGKRHLVELGNGGEPACYRLRPEKVIDPAPLASPFTKGLLEPGRAHFEQDAMVFLEGAGNAIDFFAEGGARLAMRTQNLPNFALWQKAGAPYLCLEPWHGTAPLADQGDRLEDRNGIALLAPGASMTFGMDVSFELAS